jgi:hypothetical protein
MLICGAFYPVQRPLVLTIAALSKLFFISLVFSHELFRGQAGVSAVVDLVMVILFAVYLFAAGRHSRNQKA